MGDLFSWLKELNGVKAGTLFGSVIGWIVYMNVKRGFDTTALVFVAALSAIGPVVQTMVQHFLKRRLKTEFKSRRPTTWSPIKAPDSTTQIMALQLTILEKERNRLAPIAAREHWVALTFAVVAGIVFFTSISLIVFSSLTKAIVTFVASIIPGFLSKIFFSREATVEKRLKEISSDLRESEKTKERLEILEEVLKVTPSKYQARVLEDFTKSRSSFFH